MGMILLIVGLVSVLCLTALLLHKYGDWHRQHIIVSIATFISWYFSFVIISILPLDVVQTYYHRCLKEHEKHLTPTILSNTTTSSTHVIYHCVQPWSLTPPEVLKIMWLILYWASFFLTWLILPFMQSYTMSGNFSIIGKIKASLIENAIYYGSYLLVLLVLLVYVIIKVSITGSSLKTLIMAASNTWGLFFLVLLMGYGLVEIPRYVWNMSRRSYRLNRTYFQIAKLNTEKTDAEETLEDILNDIGLAAVLITPENELRPKVDIILSKCPDEFQKNLTKWRRPEARDQKLPGLPTLVSLHRKLLAAQQNVWRVEAKWEALMKSVLYLEDLVKNTSSNERIFRHHNFRELPKYIEVFCQPTIEWYWRCKIVPVLFKIAAVILITISVAVVLSEITFFTVKPTLAISALLMGWAADSYEYMWIQILSVIVLLYMCVCTYWTVFRVRVFNYYYLSPHHHTDEYTLLFSGILLCRLTPALCLNFLCLVHLDSVDSASKTTVETAFNSVMGHMEIVSFISGGFNLYYPLIMIIICGCTFFSLGSRFLNFIGFQQFLKEEDYLTVELVDEGMQLVKREKKRLSREREGIERRKKWEERLNRFGARDKSNPEPFNQSNTRSTSGGNVSSDNSGTELLDDNFMDYQDYKQKDVKHSPKTKFSRSLFDDV